MAGGPGYHREGAPSKLVLLGWGFWFHVTVCEARKSNLGQRTRGIRFLEQILSWRIRVEHRFSAGSPAHAAFACAGVEAVHLRVVSEFGFRGC